MESNVFMELDPMMELNFLVELNLSRTILAPQIALKALKINQIF